MQSFSATAASLTVAIDNSPNTGFIELQLFDSKDSFISGQNILKTVRFNLLDPQPFSLNDLTEGEYALRVYFDENDNSRLDKNFIGIPIEPIGFSNRYQPRAPPSYRHAAFTLKQQENRHFDIQLYRPLGEKGQVGVGVGSIMRTSPYREYSGQVIQAIPSITFVGEKLQVFGPRIQWLVSSRDNMSLALLANYRIGVYKENDSPFLAGMGDRDNTLLAGLALQLKLGGGIDFELAYQHDVLDRIGGGASTLRFSRPMQPGILRITPQLGINFLSSKLSSYDFGVPVDKATVQRPAYNPGSTTSIQAGFRLSAELGRNWIFVLNLNFEKLDNKITTSPLVDKDSLVKGFAALNYLF